MSADRIFLQRRVRDLDESPAYQPISRVRIHAGEDSNGNAIIYEAGSESGRTIDIDNPLILDPASGNAIAANVLAAIQGYAYKPYQADGAILDPAAEIGDAVSVGEVYSVLADIETTFSPLMTANIGAREDGTIDHEYPYESSEERAIQRSLAETRTSFIVEQGKIAGIIEDIGGVDEEGSLIYRITSVEETVGGIHAYTNEEIEKLSGAVVKEWADFNFTPKEISSKVSSYFDGAGTAKSYNDALTKSGGTLDTREIALKKSLESEISQTAQSIKATVAGATEKYDLSAIPSGTTIIKAYGILSPSVYPPSQYNGQVYVDIETGNWWQSNGTKWTRMGRLPTITSSLESSITATNNTINLEVSRLDEAIGNANAAIQVNADAISAVVNGSSAPEWSDGGSTGLGMYYRGDIVCVSSYQTIDGEQVLVGRSYYKCTADHAAVASTYPGIGQYWQSVWEPTSAPTVQTMINSSLEGLTLSYESTAQPNSAYVTLNHNGVQIGGSVITMSNVQADTIAANSYIQSPIIYDANQFGTLKFVAQSAAGQLLYGGAYDSISNAAFGVSYDPVAGNGSVFIDGVLFASGSPGYNQLYLGASSSPPTFTCYGTWDFRSANVLLPSS